MKSVANPESLKKAGVLKSLNGLMPPAAGARIAFDGARPTSTHGPFAGTTETVGGYWILDLKSQQEAIDWAKKCPASAATSSRYAKSQANKD
jgi:hypothetical protein